MANDFYQYDNEDNNSYKKMVALCIAAASLVVLIFLIILYMNTQKKNQRMLETAEAANTEIVEDDFLKDSNNFTSSDLEFWKDKADEEMESKKAVLPEDKPELASTEESSISNADENNKDSTKDTEDILAQHKDEAENNSENEETLNNQKEGKGLADIEDGKKDNYIAVKDKDGSTKYYEIIKNLRKNSYDFKNNLTNKDGVISYKDNTREALLGIDLSKYNGEIDWAQVKQAGVKFAMLRLGSRGYSLGDISLDEKFVDYAQNALQNNIAIGAYFYSQAINESEAVEEANYIVGAVAGFNVKYPIAIDVETVDNDVARTDNLTADQRTGYVKLFCDTVKNYGYKPVIYASKKMLITGLNIEDLKDYDIWIADYDVPTDYPYEFTMWQYANKGRVNGITGDVDLDLSFIDYELR